MPRESRSERITTADVINELGGEMTAAEIAKESITRQPLLTEKQKIGFAIGAIAVIGIAFMVVAIRYDLIF